VTDDLILRVKSATIPVSNGHEVSSQFLPTRDTQKSLKEARTEFEKDYLIRVLELCGGKAARAAEIAGKYRADFYDLLKKHEIKLADYKKTD
jgi:DNA-binding NtrC family response regulator